MKRFLLFAVFIGLSCMAHAQNAPPCLLNSVYVLCSTTPQPQFAQTPVSGASSGSVASLAESYGSKTFKGNTLIVDFCNGNANAPTAPISDTLSLTWFKAVQAANGSAFECGIWFAANTVGGADTVTVTPGGSNASIAMTIYEVPGLVYPAPSSSPTGPQAQDQTTSASGSGTTSPAVSVTPIVPNEYVFVGFGLGTGAQTITLASPVSLNNDSGQQNPSTPSGLFSFVSASYFKSEIAPASPSATILSIEPWDVVVATFHTLTVPIEGTVSAMAALSSGAPISGQQAVTASAVPLPNTSLTRPVCVLALSTNSLTVYVGPSSVTTSNGFPLVAGAALCNLSVANLNQLYVIASSTGSSVSWSAQ